MSVGHTNADSCADSGVDVVYTWVNNSDPEWIRMYQEACGLQASAEQSHKTANNPARFQNRNELLYSIKSIRRYAPWVRRIFATPTVRCWMKPATTRSMPFAVKCLIRSDGSLNRKSTSGNRSMQVAHRAFPAPTMIHPCVHRIYVTHKPKVSARIPSGL